MTSKRILADEFLDWSKQRLEEIKAALAANAELVLHYWEIGRDILASQEQQGWGAKIIDRLAADLFGDLGDQGRRHDELSRLALERADGILQVRLHGGELEHPFDYQWGRGKVRRKLLYRLLPLLRWRGSSERQGAHEHPPIQWVNPRFPARIVRRRYSGTV